MIRSLPRVATAIVVGAVAFIPAAAHAQATFTLLGVNGTSANAITPDGSIIAGTRSGGHLFRWSVIDGYEEVATGGFSSATGISNDGSVIAGTINSGGIRGYTWNQSTGTTVLPVVSGASRGLVQGLSGNGLVPIGSSGSTSTQAPTRWVGGVAQSIGPALNETSGRATNNDGSVVYGTRDALNDSSFKWSEVDGFTTLTPPAGYAGSTILGGTNELGTLAGALLLPGGDRQYRPALYTDGGGFVELTSQPLGRDMFAHDLSEDASVVVGVIDYIANFTGVWIWHEDMGVRPLGWVLENRYGIDLDGWELRTVAGISDDGTTIVGTAQKGGINQAFVVTIANIPAPSSLAMIGLAGFLTCGRRRR